MTGKKGPSANLFVLPVMPEKTEDEWRVHDERIAQLRKSQERKERADAWSRIKTTLLARGFAERHLEVLYNEATTHTPAMGAIELMTEDHVYIMSGNVGCGKTLAAHAWLLAKWKDAKDWNGSSLRMETAAAFARASRYSSSDGESKFDALSSPVKLVIDDLGVEYADDKGSFQVDLDELLDLRWRAKRPTLITTNLSAKVFKERYGERLYDRCRGTGRWFDVKRESMRGG